MDFGLVLPLEIFLIKSVDSVLVFINKTADIFAGKVLPFTCIIRLPCHLLPTIFRDMLNRKAYLAGIAARRDGFDDGPDRDREHDYSSDQPANHLSCGGKSTLIRVLGGTMLGEGVAEQKLKYQQITIK